MGHCTHPQLLTMKECSDTKVHLVKMSKDDPNDQVDSDNNNLGESKMIKEKVINNLPYPIPNTYNLVLNRA